jgi:hypothetical protein
VTAIVVLQLAILAGTAAEARAELRVGAAVRVITPDATADGDPIYLAGFGHGRRARGVHDDLWARSLAISDTTHTVVLTSVDLIGLFDIEVSRIQADVRARLGTAGDALSMVICSTHTHSGPDTMGLWGSNIFRSGINAWYLSCVRDAAARSIIEALANRRPAELRVGLADVHDLIRDTRDPTVIDGAMHTLAFTEPAPASTPIATMVIVACHPEVMWDDNDFVSADFPNYLRRAVERERGGTALYFSGAIGGLATTRRIEMQDPFTGKPAPQGSFRMCELYGEECAARALRSLQDASVLPDVSLDYRRQTFAIRLQNFRFRLAKLFGLVDRDLYDGPDGYEVHTETSLLKLGTAIEILCVPGELYPELWLGGVERPEGADFPDAAIDPPLRDQLTAPTRILLGLANDEIGYIIPKSQWDSDGPFTYGKDKAPYGEVNSVGPEAAPELWKAVRALVGQ